MSLTQLVVSGRSNLNHERQELIYRSVPRWSILVNSKVNIARLESPNFLNVEYQATQRLAQSQFIALNAYIFNASYLYLFSLNASVQIL